MVFVGRLARRIYVGWKASLTMGANEAHPVHVVSLNDHRLSREVDRLRGTNEQLTENVAATKAKCLELDLHLQAALKGKEMEASAAAAREGVLRTEAEQARSRADTMSQSLAEVKIYLRCG